MYKWNPRIVGWTPAVFQKRETAERFAKRLKKKGVIVDIDKSGKPVIKVVPVRISKVEYTVSGKPGRRTFDIKKIRK